MPNPEPADQPVASSPAAKTAAGAVGEGADPADKHTPPPKLSAEEQLALYEKELKEDDWGHQPC